MSFTLHWIYVECKLWANSRYITDYLWWKSTQKYPNYKSVLLYAYRKSHDASELVKNHTETNFPVSILSFCCYVDHRSSVSDAYNSAILVCVHKFHMINEHATLPNMFCFVFFLASSFYPFCLCCRDVIAEVLTQIQKWSSYSALLIFSHNIRKLYWDPKK